ncbi:hypothetical protein SAMN06297387_116106 [Streptomyces zhaozhouensis]|uniref:Uncharacterized protein n=1 Tax=Streptomyces zhaozhouensis TaxID=1300267 RepID=A0A286E0F8_9ACTN|nr:hypothetical protein [Streptomyces zhaozhouensis]SOD64382.1 hypothetical protein SAMN06297387_116106 [Streptomyces zhaozhouensis]
MSGWVKTGVLAGSGLLLAAMAGTWLLVDLERAGWVASVVGGVVGVVGLVWGIWSDTGAGGTGKPGGPVVSGTGDATATGGGLANSGVVVTTGKDGDGLPPGPVGDTGDARADGFGSDANTGWSDR